ncbi:MAG TPA: hypothetical protein VGU63_07565 [Candidatus Acidoferrales bacterium]|nr:hypothetical protein [Candidatus Acidoferrales bacterium]
MRKKPALKVIAELLPPEPRSTKTDMEALERLVAEKVHEILQERDDLLMQPFFSPRKVSQELRRLQTVPERRKWAYYFAKYGCLVCGEKSGVYVSCGMCKSCLGLTKNRLQAILAEQMREGVHPQFSGDLEAIAKKALKALPETGH